MELKVNKDKIITYEIVKKSRIQVYAKDGEIEIRQVKGE